MGYTHHTFDLPEDKINAGLAFDEGEVAPLVEKQVVAKFLKLEQEVEQYIKLKSDEFELYLSQKGLVSCMGTIGKK